MHASYSLLVCCFRQPDPAATIHLALVEDLSSVATTVEVVSSGCDVSANHRDDCCLEGEKVLQQQRIRGLWPIFVLTHTCYSSTKKTCHVFASARIIPSRARERAVPGVETGTADTSRALFPPNHVKKCDVVAPVLPLHGLRTAASIYNNLFGGCFCCVDTSGSVVQLKSRLQQYVRKCRLSISGMQSHARTRFVCFISVRGIWRWVEALPGRAGRIA